MSADKKKSARTTGKGKTEIWTAEEKAAMREYVQERKGAARRASAGKEDAESEVLAKIATFRGSDRTMGERIHAIIKSAAPALVPRLWYGMPAYSKDDKVICFFQDAAKFKARYATLGFSDKANLDDGNMWPSSFALKELTAAEETKITALVKKAVS
jgi:uncharacterized protein YdhG (YjbR/CyaY superfamily)